MNAKEYLEQLRKIDTLIKNKMIEKQQWLDIALSVTASMGGEKVQSTGKQNKMSDAIEKSLDVQQEIDNYLAELQVKKLEIIKTIEQLPEPQYDVLHLVYVQYLTLDDVASIREKSRRWVNSMHGVALKNIETFLKLRDNS